MFREGLKQALAARLFILDKMTSVLPSAREEMSDFAPRIITIKINPEKIREIIGKGGSMIRKTVRATSASGGSYRVASGRGAAATFTFTGRAMAWVAMRGTGFGKATVSVDGGKLAADRADPAVVLIPTDLPRRRVALVWHRDRYRSPAAGAFIEIAMEVGRTLAAELAAEAA